MSYQQPEPRPADVSLSRRRSLHWLLAGVAGGAALAPTSAEAATGTDTEVSRLVKRTDSGTSRAIRALVRTRLAAYDYSLPGSLAKVVRTSGSPLRAALDEHYAHGLNVMTYGAMGDGVSDDTAAVQAAIDHAALHGDLLYLPPGAYRVKGLRSDHPISLQGQRDPSGQGGTRLVLEEPGTILTCSATVTVSGIRFESRSGGQTSALRLDGGMLSLVDGCTFSAFDTSVELLGATAVTIRNSTFADHRSAAIHLDNPVADAGDHSITGNLFTVWPGAGVAAAHILVNSSGGSRISDNKLLGADRAIDIRPLAGDQVTVMVITGNSIEQTFAEQIRLEQGDPTGSYGLLVIAANELSPHAGGGTARRALLLGRGGYHLAVTGNVIVGNPEVLDPDAVAIEVRNARTVQVSGNTVSDWATGILDSGTELSELSVGHNAFFGVATMLVESGGHQASRQSVQHSYRATLPTITGDGWVGVYEVTPTQEYAGVLLQVTGSVLAQGVGGCLVEHRRAANREGSPDVTLSPVGEDVQTGAGAGGVEVGYDVASVPGSVVVRVRRTGQATSLNGALALEVRGGPAAVKQLVA